MALNVIGGLTASTALTVPVVPAVHTILDRRHEDPLRAPTAEIFFRLSNFDH